MGGGEGGGYVADDLSCYHYFTKIQGLRMGTMLRVGQGSTSTTSGVAVRFGMH